MYDQADSDDQVHEDLLTQKFDAMIDIVLPEHPSTMSEKLYESEVVIICRNGHPRIKGELTLDQYLSEKPQSLHITGFVSEKDHDPWQFSVQQFITVQSTRLHYSGPPFYGDSVQRAPRFTNFQASI